VRDAKGGGEERGVNEEEKEEDEEVFMSVKDTVPENNAIKWCSMVMR
jgi:hypothetical protein